MLVLPKQFVSQLRLRADVLIALNFAVEFLEPRLFPSDVLSFYLCLHFKITLIGFVLKQILILLVIVKSFFVIYASCFDCLRNLFQLSEEIYIMIVALQQKDRHVLSALFQVFIGLFKVVFTLLIDFLLLLKVSHFSDEYLASNWSFLSSTTLVLQLEIVGLQAIDLNLRNWSLLFSLCLCSEVQA